MNILSDKLIVQFDTSHNKMFGNITRPDMWLNNEAEEEDAPSRFDENENYLETNPQICTVIHPSAAHGYKAGDKLFVNYMAWEWREYAEDGHAIEADNVIFKIGGDLAKDTYLGEAVLIEDEQVDGFTISGKKKDSLRVRLTHIPPNNHLYAVGDIVVSIDKNNYEFNYEGKRHIKLMTNEMVAKIYDKAS